MARSSFARRTLFAGTANWFVLPAPSRATPVPIRAIAFDRFPILDPRSIGGLARKVLGERGDTLAAQWSTKLFGYSWLETAAGRYQDFPTLADAALRYSADAMGLALDDATRRMLVDQYNALDLWPDVKPALARLHTAGIRLAFLSNLSASALEANMRRNGLTDYFEPPPLSTDRVHRFKPAPKVYAMALGAFGMPREEIGFAAFAGWDSAGASWFGYRTVWVNRLALPIEPLDVRPEIISRGMEGVLALAGLT